ncbi:MAG: hypothetical protein FWE80_05960 [Oscillospiraceae bacterium]|nr:hypothetical protein [Oscillospiraceae bacterium]
MKKIFSAFASVVYILFLILTAVILIIGITLFVVDKDINIEGTMAAMLQAFVFFYLAVIAIGFICAAIQGLSFLIEVKKLFGWKPLLLHFFGGLAAGIAVAFILDIVMYPLLNKASNANILFYPIIFPFLSVLLLLGKSKKEEKEDEEEIK